MDKHTRIEDIKWHTKFYNLLIAYKNILNIYLLLVKLLHYYGLPLEVPQGISSSL